MDPVGVVGFALAASSLIASLFRTTSRLGGSHIEIHTMAMALEAETARASRWRGYHESLDAGHTTEDEEAARRTEAMVMEHLHELRAMFETFRIMERGKTSRRSQEFQISLRWITKRRMVVNTLYLCKQLNDAIDSLRQPTREIEILRRQTQQLIDGQKDIIQSLAQAREEMLGSSQQPRNPLPRISPGLEEPVSKIDLENAAHVKVLYEFALQGLLIVEKLLGSQDVTHVYERLKIWGTGLFDGPLGLVQILAAYPDHSGRSGPGASCGVFQSAFIEILLDIEQIQLAMKSENATVLAFQNDLANFLEADSPIREEIFYRTLLRSPRNGALPEKDVNKYLSYVDHEVEKLPEEEFNRYLSHMEDEVGNLFVALRAVDSMRDLLGYQLQRQPNGKTFATEKLENPVTVAEQRFGLIDEMIRLVEGVVLALRRLDVNSKGAVKDLFSLSEQFERELGEFVKWSKTIEGKVTADMTILLERLAGSLRNGMLPDIHSGSGGSEYQLVLMKPTLLGTLHTFQESIANLYMLSEGGFDHSEASLADKRTQTLGFELGDIPDRVGPYDGP
ncbi:uncharacterized protein K444DRAFT_615693 [Hyaloscypha bicolor E]|uniref:Uncharacterized protein n=1 Tax=Hyaloscypha bicolor E TaxID=1095630 RepID=A0A2J6T2I5_9HELO|nr:uncharacterized protein K444DRAFT_615693 [Hyaloscypha bicolor E]PMD57232.1 hypothetical protein K444DRAFT_615693 [Hyaloscypha bicolor E]